VDQKTCEAKGWDWINGKCVRPNIGRIQMTLPRGYPCGGSPRKRKIDNGERSLPLSVRRLLLKASAPRAAKKK
jgi:hypothetical protein